MKIMMSDIYQIRSDYYLDHNSKRGIDLLYQPLLGQVPCGVYYSLWSQIDLITLTKSPALFSYLTKMTSLSLSELNQALEKLEAVGLIKRYRKKDNTKRVLLELYLPLTPRDFVKHQVLNTLLLQRLGKEDYSKTIACFRTYDVKKDNYEDVSKRFSDVYDINLLNKVNIMEDKNFQDKKYVSIEDEYDLTMFYEKLDNLQLSNKMFNHDDEQLIKQLGLLYKIDAISMQLLVKDSMIDNKLNHELFKNNCRNHYKLKMPESFEEIHHKQSVAKSDVGGNSALDKHINYLEHITPYNMLKEKQGGKEPIKRDLQVIESVMTSLQLEPGVMNVLIELTLVKCDNGLPRAFMEAVASAWKRKKIDTVRAAIDASKAYINQHQEDIEVNDEDDYLEVVNEKELEGDELQSVLSSFD